MESDYMESKKILIVYYSRTGTTKKVAEYLRTMFSCDIEEVLDSKIRKGIIALFIGIKDAILKNKTY
jgi:flavodoxin